MKVWIDLANSPHPLFFEPLVADLCARGHEPVLTARDHAQTVELARERFPEVAVIGGRSPSGSGGGMASKAVALAEVAEGHGVEAHDVVAFGDMPNDVPMLSWAGRGFAMADGHPDALAATDLVAPPLREDGVAQVLEALLAGEDPPVVGRSA